MTASAVLVVVFAAVALGLASFALHVSLGARKDAREALDAVRVLAARTPRPRPRDPMPTHVERRDEPDAGPPPGESERRRHRAPETGALYSRLRASADTREAVERNVERAVDDATTVIPAVHPGDDLETAEHPAPATRYRRPPPPLPPPGAIGRQ